MYEIRNYEDGYGIFIKSNEEWNKRPFFTGSYYDLLNDILDMLNTSYDNGYKHGMELGDI